MCSMQVSEQELITQSLSNDAAAYGQLVERYKRAIYRHCFAIIRDEDAAEDVAQDTFITAYYKLNSFDQSRKFSTWLFKIATNKCLDDLKKAKRFVDNETAVLEMVAPRSYDTDKQARDNEVLAAISRLAPTHRVAISLFYLEGQSHEEIAEAMGKPIGSVKVWIHRAKQTLRKELA